MNATPKVDLDQIKKPVLSVETIKEKTTLFMGKNIQKKPNRKLDKLSLVKNQLILKKITINNIIYESQADAVKALGVSNGTISYRLKRGYYEKS